MARPRKSIQEPDFIARMKGRLDEIRTRENPAIERQLLVLQERSAELKTEGEHLANALIAFEQYRRQTGQRPTPRGRPPRAAHSGNESADQPKSSADERHSQQADGSTQFPASGSFPNIRAIILFLAKTFYTPFQPHMITGLLKQHYPEILKKMPPGYVSSSLWYLASKKNNPPIRLVSGAGMGGVNTYEVIRSESRAS